MDGGETGLDEVMHVLDLLETLDCRHWLEGGWGVDALVGRQTRPHRDVDVDVDAGRLDEVLTALEQLGYAVDTDWLPNRVELVAPGRGRVDVHPLILGPDGAARQAALDGGWHVFQARWFTHGSLAGRAVPCVSVEAQLAFHQGYELREIDLFDLTELGRLSRSERTAPASRNPGDDGPSRP